MPLLETNHSALMFGLACASDREIVHIFKFYDEDVQDSNGQGTSRQPRFDWHWRICRSKFSKFSPSLIGHLEWRSHCNLQL
jgi:hypothetical protein